MNLRKYSIFVLLRIFLHKLTVTRHSLIPKTSLPKRVFYSGLAGCGNFARYAYTAALNKSSNPIVISGLHSRSKRSVNRVVKALRYKTKVFDSYDDLLNSGIKSIIITLPNHLHYDYVSQALDKGLDVFCEKPLVNDLRDAIKLKDRLDKSERILMVGFNQRYLDRINKLKAFISQGHLGKIKEVKAFHNQNIEVHLRDSRWAGDCAKSGGGVLHNAGVHLMNVMFYLFGDIQKIKAEFENRKLPKNFGEDTVYCQFSFKNGIQGHLNVSCVNEVNSTYEHMIIKGDRGSITTDMFKSNIEYYDLSGAKKKSIACKKETIIDSVYNELLHFHECIVERSRPNTDIHDSINTLMIIKAATVSSKRQEYISLDEIKQDYESAKK